MTDRETLLAAICMSPEDDTPRLVFADWLEEHDEVAWARFIREQCRGASGNATPDRRWLTLGRKHAADWFPAVPAKALTVNEANWLGRMNRPEQGGTGLQRALVRHGFVERISCTLDFFLSSAAEVFRANPIREVVILDRTAGSYTGERPDNYPPGYYVWASEKLGVGTLAYVLPPDLFRWFGELGLGNPHPETPTRWFETDGEAVDALRAICLAFGRRAAGHGPP